MLTEDVYTRLKDGGTTAGTRVGPLVLATGTTYPAISYQVITTSPTESLVGSRKPDRVLVQVDCWAKSYGAAKTLASQVRALMEGAAFQGMLNDERDDHEPETGTYRVSMDFFCWAQT